MEVGSKESPSGSLGVLISGTAPASTSWFLDSCILPVEGMELYGGLSCHVYCILKAGNSFLPNIVSIMLPLWFL